MVTATKDIKPQIEIYKFQSNFVNNWCMNSPANNLNDRRINM